MLSDSGGSLGFLVPLFPVAFPILVARGCGCGCGSWLCGCVAVYMFVGEMPSDLDACTIGPTRRMLVKFY